ncbi:MAG TPA: hypothetical protein VHL54_03855 [Actinomycetota bacterium]|nr:hypothetical protein [Actinomycetota bacterium]
MPKNSPTRLFPLLLVLVLVGASCRDGASNDPVVAGVISSVAGAVELTRDGETTPAEADQDLLVGDELSVEDSASVEFRLGEAAQFQLRQGQVQIEGAEQVGLEGVMLLSSTSPVRTNVGGLDIGFSSGNLRLELPAPGRLAAYEIRDLKVVSGEQEVPIPQLWQVSVGEGGALDQARPVEFSREDPLDAVHLAHALDADGKLGNLLRGLEPQLAAVGGPALQARLTSAGVGPELAAPFAAAGLSDQLMGLAFAREWKRDLPSELVTGYQQALALKVLGASWGLVAQNFDISGDALVASLQNEINAVLFPAGSPEPGQLVPTPTPAVSRPPAAPRPPGPVVRPAPVPPPPTAPVAPPAPGASPTPGLLAPVVDPLRPLLPDELEAIVDELYGLVQGVLPGV